MRNISRGLVGVTYLLIVWGGIVRRSGSGLGCPDWPLCHGQFIPPADPATLIEYTHRLLSALVSLALIALCIGIWRSPLLRRRAGALALGALILLVAQAVLGGMVVITELKPWLVAGHLALAFLFFGLMIRIVSEVRGAWCEVNPGPRTSNLGLRTNPSTIHHAPSTTFGLLALIALYLQIILGGIVSGHQAGLACPDFPTCQGQWWPAFHGLVGMHMTHRIGAIIATILVCMFIVISWNQRLATSDQRRLLALLFLLALQIALGIGNVLLGLPLVVDVAHLAIATALFGALVHTCSSNCPTISH